MARKNKNNKGLYLITIFLLILLTSAGIISYFYFDKQLKTKKQETTKSNNAYLEKEKELKEKQKELEEEKEKLEDFENLDEKIDNLKKDYFKTIKELEDAILASKSDKKIAYLTFDDGPYYNTYKVFDILERYNVKATFFTTNINGENCYDKKSENCLVMYKEYLKRGHTIANHTYTHAIFRGLYSSVDSFMDAVVKQENHIKEQTDGFVTNILRFPGGSRTAGKLKDGIVEKLRERGYGWVDWSAEDGDGGNLQSKEQAWSTLKSSINDKIEVILLHDYNNITTSILPDVIEYLQDKGYILLPLFYESNTINK